MLLLITQQCYGLNVERFENGYLIHTISLSTVCYNICLENGDLPSSDFAVAKRFINRGGTPVEGKIEPKRQR